MTITQPLHAKIAISTLALFILVGMLLLPTPGIAQSATDSEDQYVAIDFNNVDISVFIKFISELTGRNFLVDPRIRGKVTINSPSKITVDEAYRVFESVLELNGFTTIPGDGITKIIPSAVARSSNLETILEPEVTAPDAERSITKIIQLRYADANEVRRLITPLVAKTSVILAYTQTNALIITDNAANIQRLERIIAAIDRPGVGQQITIIPLVHADAAKLAKLLSGMFTNKRGQVIAAEGQPRTAQAPPIIFLADERTNTLIISASENDIVRARELVAMLDKETPLGSERIRVYYLEHATAEDLAKVLQEVPSRGEGGAEGEGGQKQPLLSEKVRIMADKATNSLIITAEKDDFTVLEEIIDQLDIPRAMVYLECLIMEVNTDRDFQLGTQWIAGRDADIDNRRGGIGGGFGGGNDFQNIFNLVNPSTGVGTLPPGFSLGIFSELVKIGGIQFPNLAAIVNAYKNDKDVHILSTPQLLTTNNQEASITVGRNVPFQTRTGQSDVEAYNTYEYRDVGITLKITPQISKDGLIRLQIFQEVTRLEDLSGGTTTSDRPTTLKRTIETTVVAKDRSTVVIGGLIDDAFSASVNQVPCLGAIPLFGYLFKSHGDATEKTNLYAFITPRVVKNTQEAKALYDKKRTEIDTVREGAVKLYKNIPLKDIPPLDPTVPNPIKPPDHYFTP